MQFSFFSLTRRKEMKEKKTPNRQNLCFRLTWDHSSMKKPSERSALSAFLRISPPFLRACVCVCVFDALTMGGLCVSCHNPNEFASLPAGESPFPSLLPVAIVCPAARSAPCQPSPFPPYACISFRGR